MSDKKHLDEVLGRLALINILSDLDTELLSMEHTPETKTRFVDDYGPSRTFYTGKVRIVLELYRPVKQDES
jgi:hypothetical protein